MTHHGKGLRPFVSLVALGLATSVAVAQVPARSANAPVNDPDAAATEERARKAYNASAQQSKNMRLVGANDLAGRTAYQPTIKEQNGRWILYVGHHGGRAVNPLTKEMEENGTSILDVTNPASPKLLVHVPGDKGREVPGREVGGAQMVRVCRGDELPKGDKSKVYMLRSFGDTGQEMYDVSKPEAPVRLWRLDNIKSTHKNFWECDTGIAYLVHTGDESKWRIQRITNIYDLSDPAKPLKIREFGLPEQLKTSTGYLPAAIHGPISAGPSGNRVFFGYGTNRRGVAQIVDREKLLKGPAEITEENLRAAEVGRITLPEFIGAHTAFPLYNIKVPGFASDTEKGTRNFVVVVNETNITVCAEPRQLVYFVDVTDESRPIGVATYEPNERSGKFCDRGGRFGAHASHENMTPIFHGKIMFFSWFNAGVRMVDVRDPYKPRELGYFIPAVNRTTDYRCADERNKRGCVRVVQINNMEVDDRGYVYAVDRANSGVFVLEVTGEARRIADFKSANAARNRQAQR